MCGGPRRAKCRFAPIASSASCWTQTCAGATLRIFTELFHGRRKQVRCPTLHAVPAGKEREPAAVFRCQPRIDFRTIQAVARGDAESIAQAVDVALLHDVSAGLAAQGRYRMIKMA